MVLEVVGCVEGWVGELFDAVFGEQRPEAVFVGGDGEGVVEPGLEHDAAFVPVGYQRSEGGAFLEHDERAGRAVSATDVDGALEYVDEVVAAVAVAFDDHARVVVAEDDHPVAGPFEELLVDGHPAVAVLLSANLLPGDVGFVDDGEAG